MKFKVIAENENDEKDKKCAEIMGDMLNFHYKSCLLKVIKGGQLK